MEEISLLVHRVGGRMFQVLADESALYVLYLGNLRSRAALRRAVAEPSQFLPGAGTTRIAKERVDFVRIFVGLSQTEISLTMLDGEEYVWYVNCGVPEEALLCLFAGVRMHMEPLPLARELVDVDPEALPEGVYDSLRIRQEFGMDAEEAGNGADASPVPGPEGLAGWGLNALSVLFPALWWLNQSVPVFALNLLFLPAALLFLGRTQGGRQGRFSPVRLLWLLPGIGLMLINVRINLTDPVQVVLPAAAIALLLALMYALICAERRSWRKVAVVLALALLTYAPGAALSLNTLRSEQMRIVRVDPMLIRPGWVDVRLDGAIERMYASPQVTRTLSSAGWCELRLYRGMMGIEYWMVMPGNLPDAI